MPAASPWYCVPWYVASRSNALGASSGMEGGIERHGAHVHGRERRVVAERRRHESPATSGVDHEPVAPREPLAGRDPREAPDAVAAHLGEPAVGVAELHRAVRAVRTREERDQPVRTHAPMAIAESARDRGVGRAGAVESDDDEEVVPGPMELRDVRHALHLASRAGSSAHGLSTVPNHAMRGSRRNHMRWRRANDRVRRVTVANASSRPLCPSRWASSSL